MKIAYVMQNYNASSELWMRRQIEYLGADVKYFCSIDSKDKSFKGVDVVNLYRDYPVVLKVLMKLGLLRKKTRDERFEYVFNKNLCKYNPEIIFINYLNLAYKFKNALNRFEGDIFIQVHGYDVTWDFVSLNGGDRVWGGDYFEFARDISKKAIFIANSKFTEKNLLTLGISKERIQVRYFGVPNEEIEKNKYLPRSSIKILYLGRLVDCKAPDLVIQAFDYACKRGMSAELIIAGDGYLMNTCKLIKGRSKFSDRISLLGAVSPAEGAKLRAQCDIFTAHNCTGAITNQIESFGVSIVEAMSAGLPVVTGKSGGVVESVVDGETGFLFTPGDVKKHGDLLYELSSNHALRKEMGTKSYQRANSIFSLENERIRTLEIIRGS